MCVILHTVCEITQCAQNYTYSIGKNSSQLENFTLTALAALATNISCARSRSGLGELHTKSIKQENLFDFEVFHIEGVCTIHAHTDADADGKSVRLGRGH